MYYKVALVFSVCLSVFVVYLKKWAVFFFFFLVLFERGTWVQF